MNTQLSFTIRPERKSEFPQIYHLIQTAFATAKVSDGDEQDFADRLRCKGNYIPELALVAECNGQLIGHVMFTKTQLILSDNRPFEALMVAPLSVALEYRCQGVGSALLQEGLLKAADRGYKAAFLCGDPAYYQRFGFRAISHYAIRQKDLPEELAPYFMARELIAGSLQNVSGTIDLHS